MGCLGERSSTDEKKQKGNNGFDLVNTDTKPAEVLLLHYLKLETLERRYDGLHWRITRINRSRLHDD